MLLGSAVVIAFVCDRCDDCRLIVVPTVSRDTGLLPDQRAGAVRSDQQPGGNRLTACERGFNRSASMFKASHRVATQLDPKLSCLFNQRVDQMPVFNHMRKRLPLFHFAAES